MSNEQTQPDDAVVGSGAASGWPPAEGSIGWPAVPQEQSPYHVTGEQPPYQVAGGQSPYQPFGWSDQTPLPPVQPPVTRRRRWGTAGGGVAAGAGVAAKAGLLTKLLLLLKSATLLVKFKVLATMAISVIAYAFIFGWWYAVGFVALIAIHEVGHLVVLRAQGVRVSAPTFIPFFGAFVKMESAPRSVAAEATGALAGPAVGAAAALATLQLSHVTHSQLLQALAYTAFFLNLFNLFPVLPLDGGRVAGALHPALWILGLGVAVFFVLSHPNPVLILVLIMGAFELVRRWKSGRWVQESYYKLAPSSRLSIGAAYLGVAALCLWGMHVAYIPR